MEHELELLDRPTTALDSGSCHAFAIPRQRPARTTDRVRVQRSPAKPDREAVFVRDGGVLYRVDRASIRVVRAQGNYVVLQCDERRFMLRNSLAHVVDQLNDLHFIQVNRGLVVNLRRVKRVESDCVHLDQDIETLSSGYRKALLERLQVLGGH